MIRDLVVRAEAEIELAKAYQWYEEKRPGLGDELLLCVDAAMEQVLKLTSNSTPTATQYRTHSCLDP